MIFVTKLRDMLESELDHYEYNTDIETMKKVRLEAKNDAKSPFISILICFNYYCCICGINSSQL